MEYWSYILYNKWHLENIDSNLCKWNIQCIISIIHKKYIELFEMILYSYPDFINYIKQKEYKYYLVIFSQIYTEWSQLIEKRLDSTIWRCILFEVNHRKIYKEIKQHKIWIPKLNKINIIKMIEKEQEHIKHKKSLLLTLPLPKDLIKYNIYPYV
jgi:hypothetical protein